MISKFNKRLFTTNLNPKKQTIFKKLFLVAVGTGTFGAGLFLYNGYQTRLAVKVENKNILDDYRKKVAILEEDNEKTRVLNYGWNFRITLFMRYIQIFCLILPALSMYYVNRIFESETMSFYLWEYIGYVSQNLGGMWIKMGQWASTRPDLFSPASVEKISFLVNQCPIHPFETTQKIIFEQFGVSNLNEIFEYFDIVPMASGAIAQVYTAMLHGEKVAVKILHPDIVEIMEKDLMIMETLKNKLFFFYPDAQWFGLDDALVQFRTTMKSQTDLRIEAENLKLFQKNFETTPNIIFPEYRKATKGVLVETFCEGTSFKDYLKENHDLDEKKFLAKFGLQAFLKMIVIDNFVHADMHSGNLLVNYDPLEKNSKKSNENHYPNLVILDVGLTTFAEDTDLDLIKGLFTTVGSNNPGAAANLLFENSQNSRKREVNEADKEGFMKEMTKFFDNMYHSDPTYYEGGGGLSEMVDIQRKYKVQHPGNLTTLLLGMLSLEGIGKQLYSDETRIFEHALALMYETKKEDNVFVKKYRNFTKKMGILLPFSPTVTE